MVRKLISEIHSFIGGLVKDIQNVGVPRNKYIDAQNIKLTDPTSDTLGAATTSLGNEYVFNLGAISFASDADDYTGLRIVFDTTSALISHDFTINGGGLFTISSALATPILRYNDLSSKFIAAVLLQGITASKYIDDPAPSVGGVKYVGFKLFGVDSTNNTESTIAGDYTIQILKEFYGVASNGVFVILKTKYIGADLYILSTNSHVFKIVVAKKDETTGTWASTTLFQTKSIVISDTMIGLIDVDIEIDFGNRVSIYYTGKGYIPRVTYFKLEDTWTADNAFIWNENPAYIVTGNPDGYYVYESVEQETRLQVLQNYAHLPCYDEVIFDLKPAPTVQAGGQLTAGDKMYTVRQLITNDAATAWGLISNPIPIFSDSITDPNLSGNIGGQITDKSITMTIVGLNPILYNQFQVAVLENIDGVISGNIIGTYTLSNTDETITHRGNEAVTTLSIAELVAQQLVIEDAGSLVINRNRLFLSNIKIAVDPDIAEAIKLGTTITTSRKSLPAQKLSWSGGPVTGTVGEYQDPISVFLETGCMLNETYRLGVEFILKASGRVIGPYFCGDWLCDYTDNYLTDNPGGIPDNIYVYHPIVNFDFTGFPQIDGVDFKDAIDGFMIVRQECVPEVITTGVAALVIPGYNGTSEPVWVGNGRISGIVGLFTEKRLCTLLSPDVLFKNLQIDYNEGLKIRNYGQPFLYNEFTEVKTTGIVADYCDIKEFSGDYDSKESANITLSEDVPFLSEGNTLFGDTVGAVFRKFSTTFRALITSTTTFIGNCNQHISALKTDGDLNPITANTNYDFFGVQVYKTLTNKYGEENQGKYISCGHFTFHYGDATVSVNVFGGDTFTQKTVIKYSNARNYLVNDEWRQGVSFYSQNRINTQMRYFSASNTFLNYPYQTTSLVQWLSGANPGDAQDEPGQLSYSDSYTPVNNVQTLQVYNPDLPVQSELPNVTQYSGLKIGGSTQDPYRSFLPADQKFFPAIYGGINNTFKHGNSLWILMDNVVLSQQLDQQSIQQGEDSISIILGNGTVLGAREEVVSNYGSPIKTGALQYLSRAGTYSLVWWNQFYKKILKIGGNGIEDLGNQHSLNSFFLENNQFIGSEMSMIMGYDDYSGEFLMRAKYALSGAIPYNPSDPYNEGDIISVKVFTGSEQISSYLIYFKAKIDVPAGKTPTDIANQLQYWEIYRNSNYTLAYNDKLNEFSGFYGYVCDLFIPYNNTFLTDISVNIDPSHPLSYVYEHNRGEYLTWYDSAATNAYIKYVLNYEPDEFKSMRNVWIRSENQPLYGFAVGSNGTKTYLSQSDFQRKGDRKYWWANIKNDATIDGTYLGGVNTTGINTLPTKRITGETIEITLFFEDYNKINETKNTYSLRPRNTST